MGLIYRSWLRESLRHPILLVLSVLGVALGVATVVAVDIANESAKRSFLAANETVSGTTTHRFTGAITDELYWKLRVDQSLAVTPVVEGMIEVNDSDGPKVRLYGVDLLAEISDQTNAAWFNAGIGNASTLITEAFTVLATKETASLLNWVVGEELKVSSENGEFSLQLIGLLNPANPLQAQSLRYLLLTDIATAQAVLNMYGKLSAIHANFDDSFQIEEFEQALPDGVRVESQIDRRDSQLALTNAFQINLTALGLLAFLVAMFLIYSTTSFTVMRRRRLIGLIRALGALQRNILYCVLVEVFFVGVIATAIGFFLGIQLSSFLLELVERSIDTLYFPVSAEITVVTSTTIVKGVVLGIGATILSVVPVFRNATSIAPSIAMHHSQADALPKIRTIHLLVIGVAFIAVGLVVIGVSLDSIIFGFAGIFFVIVGYLFIVPLFTGGAKSLLRPVVNRLFGVQGLMVTRAFSSRPGQTSITIAVLCLALSATIGVDVMVNSFRLTVDQWLTSRLRGDIYITTSSRFSSGLQVQDIQLLENIEGIESFGVAKWAEVPDSSGMTTIFAADYGEDAFKGFEFKEISEIDLWSEFSNGAVIVSEPYAYRTGIETGDSIQLFVGRNPVEFPVIGIFYDYSSDQGIVAIHRDTYVEKFGDTTISSASIYSQPNANLQHLADTIESQVSSPTAQVWRNQELHDASMQVFDQTFAITYVLRTLAIIVAFVAVFSALATLQIEREKELVVLRTIGFTVRRNWTIASAETGFMGFLAGIFSIPIGIFMAWLLIWVIEQRSFGWTMKMHVDPAILGEAVLLSVCAALIAGAIAAWRHVRRTPALALQGMD